MIKFDFFFLLGFMVQVVILMNNPDTDPERWLTVAGIFVAFAMVCLAIYFAMTEHKLGTIAIIVRIPPFYTSTLVQSLRRLSGLTLNVLKHR